MEELFAIKIFAGSGRLTCELRKVGLGDSVGVDHQVGKCLIAPIIKLDLQDPEAQKLLRDMLDNPNCVYVHLAPPCGTASRARTIPQGRAPEPARSDVHPDGLPGLKSESCKNPGRSFMWDTIFWKNEVGHLEPLHTLFHHCMWGGTRRKLTRLVHNAAQLNQLKVLCCGESERHIHEPWGRLEAGGWATSQKQRIQSNCAAAGHVLSWTSFLDSGRSRAAHGHPVCQGHTASRSAGGHRFSAAQALPTACE